MHITWLAVAFTAFVMFAGIEGKAQPGKLPVHAAPAGLQSIDGASGGRLLVGTLSKQSSTDAAFRAGLKSIRSGYFDATPNLVGVLRSTDESVTMAPFTATLGKAPMNGTVYTLFDPNGTSRVGVLFDFTQHFGKTFKPLMARFTESIPPPAASTELKYVVALDGTDAATVPSNWQIQSLQQGQLVVRGPDQALVIIRYLTYFTDPKYPKAPGTTPMSYTSDPTEGMSAVAQTLAARSNLPPPTIHVERSVPEPKPQGIVTSAWLYGTASAQGQTRRFQTLIQVTPLDANGRWIVQFNQRSAPIGVFQRDLPVMTKVYGSYRYDARRQAINIINDAQARLDANNRVYQQSMQIAAAIQGNIDRSTKAFVDHISDHARVSDGNGGVGRFTANTAQAIVESDPQNFHIMSLNEYK